MDRETAGAALHQRTGSRALTLETRSGANGEPLNLIYDLLQMMFHVSDIVPRQFLESHGRVVADAAEDTRIRGGDGIENVGEK